MKKDELQELNEKVITIFECYQKMNISKDDNAVYWFEFYHERLDKKQFVEHFKNTYDANILSTLYDAYSGFDVSYLSDCVYEMQEQDDFFKTI